MVMMVVAVATAPFLMTEDQRFDHHWDRLGIGKLLANVNKIEIPEVDPINGNDA